MINISFDSVSLDYPFLDELSVYVQIYTLKPYFQQNIKSQDSKDVDIVSLFSIAYSECNAGYSIYH